MLNKSKSDDNQIAFHTVEFRDARQNTPALEPELLEQQSARVVVGEDETEKVFQTQAWRYEVRKLYRALTNPVFVIDRDGVFVYQSSWTWAPDLAQTLKELLACEKAKAKNQMVRMCYSEKLVGLTRHAKISLQVHRRAGPEAVKTFQAQLENERVKG